MEPRYEAEAVAAAFDAYGEREWERHEASPADRVAFAIHVAMLEEQIREGERVLEVGAGPGRFTIQLARLGARVTVADLSPGQLELNERHVRDAGVEGAVEARVVADLLDLSAFPEGSFDAVVCYGAPLSFVMEGADDALAEMLRVTRRGGVVLLGVASRFGTMRAFLPALRDEIADDGAAWAERVVVSGDLVSPHSSLGVPMHLFTWGELCSLFARHGCEVLSASAANFLSTGDPEACRSFASDPALWDRFLAWEMDACREPGAIDGGTHIIAAVRR